MTQDSRTQHPGPLTGVAASSDPRKSIWVVVGGDDNIQAMAGLTETTSFENLKGGRTNLDGRPALDLTVNTGVTGGVRGDLTSLWDFAALLRVTTQIELRTTTANRIDFVGLSETPATGTMAVAAPPAAHIGLQWVASRDTEFQVSHKADLGGGGSQTLVPTGFIPVANVRYRAVVEYNSPTSALVRLLDTNDNDLMTPVPIATNLPAISVACAPMLYALAGVGAGATGRYTYSHVEIRS